MSLSQNSEILLSKVEEFVDRLNAINLSAARQLVELQAFREGRRRSHVPLGAKFLMNMGAELQFLIQEVEQWTKLVEPRRLVN